MLSQGPPRPDPQLIFQGNFNIVFGFVFFLPEEERWKIMVFFIFLVYMKTYQLFKSISLKFRRGHNAI